MQKHLGYAGILAAALIGAAVFGYVYPDEKKPAVGILQDVAQPATRQPLIDAARFLDRPEFVRVWNQKPKSIDGKIIAGTVNHHVLASDLLAHFFLTLAANRPDISRIVVLSPDHFYAGRTDISTHIRPYQTPDGVLDIDRDAVKQAEDIAGARQENGEMYEKEHGIGALAPFIKRTLPEARLVPLSVKGNAPLETTGKIAALLQALDDGKTVFVISADMSHYLPKQQAQKNDQETKQWLRQEDSQNMAKAKDTHTDSGRQFVALFRWLQEKEGNVAFHLLDEGISSAYVTDTRNTTSYLNGFWVQAP